MRTNTYVYSRGGSSEALFPKSRTKTPSNQCVPGPRRLRTHPSATQTAFVCSFSEYFVTFVKWQPRSLVYECIRCLKSPLKKGRQHLCCPAGESSFTSSVATFQRIIGLYEYDAFHNIRLESNRWMNAGSSRTLQRTKDRAWTLPRQKIGLRWIQGTSTLATCENMHHRV